MRAVACGILIFSMFAQASMVGVWGLPNGSQVLIPFHHPFKVPVLLLSPSGTHQIKEGVWLKESKALHLKSEGERTLAYRAKDDILILTVDGQALEMKRTATVKEQHYTSGIWKDIHNEDIIPIFTDNKQWLIRYYSQSPPRLYEANWSDKEGGTLMFPSTPPCKIHFEAGNANQGQLVCGDATTFLEKIFFSPAPQISSPLQVDGKSKRSPSRSMSLRVSLSNQLFFLPPPAEPEPIDPQSPPTEKGIEAAPIAKEAPPVTEALSDLGRRGTDL